MNFPFGEPVLKVEQKDKTPKKVFILGVYASAVHAKWISPEGKPLIKAMAVASEPYIFWRNKDNEAEQIIGKINISKEAGVLISADEKYNGPSGNILDTEYLKPLGIERKDCWLCDLVPYSLLNSKQANALTKKDYLFSQFKIAKQNMTSAAPGNRKIDDKRREEIVEEIKKSKAKYLITLGNEPIINFVKVYNPEIKQLNQKEAYGTIRDILIDGYSMKLIALVHPRQAGKLGGYSEDWYKIHTLWKSSNANTLRKELESN